MPSSPFLCLELRRPFPCVGFYRTASLVESYSSCEFLLCISGGTLRLIGRLPCVVLHAESFPTRFRAPRSCFSSSWSFFFFLSIGLTLIFRTLPLSRFVPCDSLTWDVLSFCLFMFFSESSLFCRDFRNAPSVVETFAPCRTRLRAVFFFLQLHCRFRFRFSSLSKIFAYFFSLHLPLFFGPCCLLSFSIPFFIFTGCS